MEQSVSFTTYSIKGSNSTVICHSRFTRSMINIMIIVWNISTNNWN